MENESKTVQDHKQEECKHDFKYTGKYGVFSQTYKCTKCGKTYIEFD